MKFKTRMIVTFSALITAAFAVLMSLVYLTVSHANQQLVSSTSVQLFDAKAREAGDWLAQRVSELEIIALSPAVQSMDFDNIRPFVETLNADVGQRYGNQWGTFAIGMRDGIGWVAQDKTIDVSGRDYFERAMTGNEPFILSEPVTYKTDNAPIALICYPLRKDGVPYGFINGAIALNRLTELAQGIDFYDGVSWIMDSEGRNYTVLPEALSEDTACLLLQQPNYFGLIEDAETLFAATSEKKVKGILHINPIAAALLPSAKEAGAVIAVGEGQPLGMPLNFGGPYLGFMASVSAMMRKLPGRIVGQSTDHEGRRAYVLTLQAREQHIRREKASSSICSNQALCALRAAIYCSAMGTEGIEQVASHCVSNAHYLAQELCEKTKLKLKYPGEFFHEFVTVSEVPSGVLLKHLEDHGILGGLPLSDHEILWCATEVNNKENMDHLVELIGEVAA